MESHITGSENEPFYDLLHPNPAPFSSLPPQPQASSTELVKQMDDLGFEKDIVLPSYNSQTQNPHTIHSSSEYREVAQSKWEHDKDLYQAATITAVECTMKKHGDNLLNALEGICGRLTKLEHKTHHLESSVGKLKMSVGNSHGETDGRMRSLENLLREVQTGVQILRDKQEIAEAHSQLVKSQPLKNDCTASQQSSESKSIDSQYQPGPSAQPQSTPPFSFFSQPQTSLSVPAQNILLPSQTHLSGPSQHNAIPAPQPQPHLSDPPQHNAFPDTQPQPHLSGPLQHNAFPAPQPQPHLSGPPQHTAFPAPQPQQSVSMQTYASPSLGPKQEQLPLTSSVPSEPSYQNSLQSSTPLPAPRPQQHEYQVPSHVQQVPPSAVQMPPYSEHSQLQQPSSQVASIPYGQSELPPPGMVQPMPHAQMAPPTPLGNYGPEPPYMLTNYGVANSRQQPQPMPSQLPLPSSQRSIGGQQAYEASFGRKSAGTLPSTTVYGPGPVHGDSQSYSGPRFRVPQSDPSAPSGGSGHLRLPTAKPVQRSLPMATSISSSTSGSSASTNRVPVDDVIDKVSSMGFSRDQVKVVVRKLTENGQTVDLNVVLDKLMNGGEIQPQKGWFGR